MNQTKEKLLLAWRDLAKAFFSRLRGYRLPEAKLIEVEFEPSRGSKRLNMVLPCLSARSTFGGIATAIRLFKALNVHFEYARIIVLEEEERQFERDAWVGWSLETDNPSARRSVVFMGSPTAILKISTDDAFIATQWKTAYQVKHLTSMLAGAFRDAECRFVYLIQDFEPAFYPWSSQYLMADSTYSDGEKILAVFNTRELADYFRSENYVFQESYCFEPKLNEQLAALRERARGGRKDRLILVYGRPSSHRNAFELIVESLHEWSKTYAAARTWTIISLGEQHKTIKLASGAQMRSFGKVSMEEYASFMTRASIGLSLMVSPHPSYPPLEMADFGVRVITNRFAGKNLTKRGGNIVNVLDTSPVGIASALRDQCEEFEGDEARDTWERKSAFLAEGDEFPFTESLVLNLKAQYGAVMEVKRFHDSEG